MIGYNKSELIGKMRERVIIQNKTISQSDSGFQSENWTNIQTVWAKVDYSSGFEEEEADRIVAQQKIKFTLRYNVNISVNSRFLYRSNYYQIETVAYSDDRSIIVATGFYRQGY